MYREKLRIDDKVVFKNISVLITGYTMYSIYEFFLNNKGINTAYAKRERQTYFRKVWERFLWLWQLEENLFIGKDKFGTGLTWYKDNFWEFYNPQLENINLYGKEKD